LQKLTEITPGINSIYIIYNLVQMLHANFFWQACKIVLSLSHLQIQILLWPDHCNCLEKNVDVIGLAIWVINSFINNISVVCFVCCQDVFRGQ
jgi:hypothetical protein